MYYFMCRLSNSRNSIIMVLSDPTLSTPPGIGSAGMNVFLNSVVAALS